MKKLILFIMTIVMVCSLSTVSFAEGYTTKAVPSNNSFKAYMSYTAITNTSSPQYKLQQQAYTGNYGIRMVDDRYCIAVGSYYTTTIGTKIDVIMENGHVIKCIVGDCKADAHTDSTHRANPNGCVVEFIVDMSALDSTCRRMGDMSYVSSLGLDGEISALRVYDGK